MEFRLLGPVEVWDGNRRLPVGGPKPRALLAMLLLGDGRVISADRLVGLIWGEQAPDSARGLIQTYISALRRTLGPEVIETRPPGYLLHLEGHLLDLKLFEQLVADARRAEPETAERMFRQADSLWRGSALGGIGEVLSSEAAHLDELRLTVVEERIAVGLLLERHAESVSELSTLVASHPAREGLRGQLMTALYRLGRSADALAIYDEGRIALAEELGIDPGPDLRILHQAILRGDPLPSSAAAPSPQPFVPAQLPPDVQDFAGRSDVVAELMPQLTAGRTAPPVLVISGKGGVGKSTVAVHLAHRVAHHYPDGQLFADLRGMSDTPMTDQEVLGRFLRALGVEQEAQPESPQERADLYRSLLAQRQILVVLDDARNEQQIRPLVPGGAGCAVLITARGGLAGLAGAHRTDLDVLDHSAALDLLGSIVGSGRVAAEPEAATEIVRLCGQLPLAVRTVGARLANRRHWSLAGMAARLTDERRRLDELTAGDVEVRASVSLSYRLLDEQARTAFRRLGLLGVPDFSPWIIGPLLEVSANDADEIAERLLDARLLDFASVDGTGQPRYQLHALLRVFAAECAERDDSEAVRALAIGRVLGSWRWLIGRLDALSPSGEITLSATHVPACPVDEAVAKRVSTDPGAWLEAETPSLIVGVARAAALDLDVIACDLAVALSFNHAFVANKLTAWHGSHEAALQAARRAGNRLGEATLLAGLGYIRFSLDHFDDAQEHFSRALPLFVETGELRGEAVVLAGIGTTCREQSRLREGLAPLTRAAAIFHELGEDSAVGETARMAAAIHLELGGYEATGPLLDQALAAFRRAGSRRGEALTLRTAGLVQRALGDYAAAGELSAQALELLRAVGGPLMIAFGVQALVKAEIRQGRGTGSSLSSLVDALETCRTYLDRYGEALMLRTIGEFHLAAGHLEPAQARLMESIALSEELRTPLPAARAKRDLAAVLTARGDRAGASALVAAAMTVFQAHGAREYEELSSRERADAPPFAGAS